MLPTAYPYDRRALLDAWQQFVAQGTCELDTLDPAVLRSWHRCRQTGLASTLGMDAPRGEALLCGDAAVLEQRLQAHFDLIAIARPFMEDIYQFVGGRDVVTFLTDRDLCLLDEVGDLSLQKVLQAAGFERGALLSEERIGTNAAALALSEGVPVQVVGPEHYCIALHALAETAAPIHAPHGELLGVLGIVTLEKDAHLHTLGVAMSAAKAIENQLTADLSLSEVHQHLAELNVTLEAVSKGILFLDAEGRVTHVNARAGEILHIPHRLAMGRDIRSLLTLPAEVENSMAQRTPMREKEVVFQSGGKLRSCVASLNPLWEGSRLSGFVLTLEHTAEVRQLVHRMVGARAHLTFDDIVGQDVEMQRVLRYARTVAQSDANVLLLGESGTGKEAFAQAIHNASRRANGPFIAVNCAAVPSGLMAIELFGCTGTFLGTGEESRPGRFELADGGTIFLDNVDELSLDVQANLVHIIDTKDVVRLGGTSVIPLDVRIIAASNHTDLAGEVRKGRLRDDLFYRLHVLTLTIPPLRERGRDIPLLALYLVEKIGRRLGKSVTISPGAMTLLQSYHWPGNTRELENVLEQAMHMVDGKELTVEHLPSELRSASIAGAGEHLITLQEAERQAIIRAGRALQGNVTQMANVLGIGRTTLWRKMRAFKIPPDSFKNQPSPDRGA